MKLAIVGNSSSLKTFFPSLKKFFSVKYLVSKHQDRSFDPRVVQTRELSDPLKDPDVDAFFVCRENEAHYEAVRTILEQRKSCLVEKPVVLCVEHLEELIRISQRTGVVCQAVFQYRFLPAFIAARDILLSGKLGKMIAVSGQYFCKRRADYFVRHRGAWQGDGGGVLVKQAIHCLDLMLMLSGRPEAVRGVLSNRKQGKETEDSVVLSFSFSQGIGSFIASRVSDREDFSVEFTGTKGCLIFDAHGGFRVCGKDRHIAPLWFCPKKESLADRQIRSFADAVRTGRVTEGALESCRDLIAVLERVYGKVREKGFSGGLVFTDSGC